VGLDVGLETRWSEQMLSDAKARQIAPGGKSLAAGMVPGLYLRPSSARGQGSWFLRFVSPVTGRRRDLGLGAYPEVGIAQARKLAMEARSAIADGRDPIEARRIEAAETRAVAADRTFREAAHSVHAELRDGFRNAKHAAQWINTLEAFVFPKIGDRSVSGLRAADFAEALRPIWLAKPETASRVKQRCDTVMNWCAARDIIVASPLKVVTALLPAQPGKRERVEHHPTVPWRELPAVCRTLFRDKPETTGRLLLEFVILTACRSGEARGMTWSEIDQAKAIWTIPAGRMKARLIHRVPLAAKALEILRYMEAQSDGSPLVFVSRRGTALSDMTLTKILRDAAIASDTAGRTATVHGFRSSFRDWASEHAYPRDLAERALAHTIRDATEAAYHRTDLLDQRRSMMDVWGKWLAA
jgi:integrase